jgi:TonB family protein
VIRQEGPRVPPGFWETHRGGVVYLKVRVGRDGAVLDEKVVSSSGRDYSSLAIEAVRTWRYNPARCDGFAIDFDIDVTMKFAPE